MPFSFLRKLMFGYNFKRSFLFKKKWSVSKHDAGSITLSCTICSITAYRRKASLDFAAGKFSRSKYSFWNCACCSKLKLENPIHTWYQTVYIFSACYFQLLIYRLSRFIDFIL
ncbi:unnamed protein product [Citrullus colocynthis]|uniref:Uncharacterized protein n=1 Tax=Citrullus colocynthis TaxID=252529 RepID=A0ABP0YNN8_9ROSI